MPGSRSCLVGPGAAKEHQGGTVHLRILTSVLAGLRAKLLLLLLAVITSSALLVVSSAQGGGVSGRQAAVRTALAALDASRHSGAEVVFGLANPLPAGTVIRSGGPSNPSRGGNAAKSTSGVIARANRPAWFFYEDLAPFQQYEHPGRVALVDVRTGRVSVTNALSWPPLLDGRLPAFLRSASAYDGITYRVFYRPYTGSAALVARDPARMTPHAQMAALDPTLAPQLAPLLVSQHACTVRFSDTIHGGYYAFATIAQSGAALYYRFSQLARLAPGFLSFICSRAVGMSPMAFVAHQISEHGCKDVLLYLAGGGYARATAVNIGMGTGGREVVHQDVTAAGVRGLLSSHRDVNFELVLDAAQASGFQALGALSNVLLVATPVAPGGGSFTYLPEARVGGRLVANDTNPLHLLQLTDRLAFGLDRVIDDSREVSQLQTLRQSGRLPSALAYLVARAFDRGGRSTSSRARASGRRRASRPTAFRLHLRRPRPWSSPSRTATRRALTRRCPLAPPAACSPTTPTALTTRWRLMSSTAPAERRRCTARAQRAPR